MCKRKLYIGAYAVVTDLPMIREEVNERHCPTHGLLAISYPYCPQCGKPTAPGAKAIIRKATWLDLSLDDDVADMLWSPSIKVINGFILLGNQGDDGAHMESQDESTYAWSNTQVANTERIHIENFEAHYEEAIDYLKEKGCKVEIRHGVLYWTQTD